jgi:hypothetical protein
MQRKSFLIMVLLALAMLSAVETRLATSPLESLQANRDLQAKTSTTTVVTAWWLWLIYVIGIVFGIPLCFFGVRWWAWNGWVMAVLGGIRCCALAQIVFVFKYDSDTQEVMNWVWLVVYICVIAGFILLFYCTKGVAGGVIGGLMGAVVSYAIIVLVIECRNGLNDLWWLNLVIAVIFVTAGVFVGCKWAMDFKIIGTAVVGGYSFMTSVALLINAISKVTEAWVAWLWLGLTIAMVAAGIFVQCAWTKKHGHSQSLTGNVQMEATVTIS